MSSIKRRRIGLPDSPDWIGEIFPAGVDDAGWEDDDTSSNPHEQSNCHDRVEDILGFEFHVGIGSSACDDDVSHIVNDKNEHWDINEIEHATVED